MNQLVRMAYVLVLTNLRRLRKDYITGEMFKSSDICLPFLEILFNSLHDKEGFHMSKSKAIIIHPILSKRRKTIPENYCATSLLSVFGKLVTKSLSNRLYFGLSAVTKLLKNKLTREQIALPLTIFIPCRQVLAKTYKKEVDFMSVLLIFQKISILSTEKSFGIC